MTGTPEPGGLYVARRPDLHSDVVIASVSGDGEKVRIIDYDTGKHRIEIPTSLLNAHYQLEEEQQL